MSQYEIYIFILCLIVFVLLVSVFSYMLTALLKLYYKAIHAGLEDEKIKSEYESLYKKSKTAKLTGCAVSLAVGVVFVAFFAFSLFLNLQKDSFYEHIPTLKMVNSGSMSQKHEKNTYLTRNNLNNQIQIFDLICIYKVPAENDLKLYDIVLYEVDETYIVHRIVGIEEPNESHPDKRYFLCQGDASEYPDRFPVYYSQIKGIYKNQRIPFIGSFVAFMQSPAGWLCFLLVAFATFGMPILERKIQEQIKRRLQVIGFIDEAGNMVLDTSVTEERELVTNE